MRRFLANPALMLAILAGISSLVLSFAVGYVIQNYFHKNGDLSIWLKYVVVPLAVSTLLGVLSSRVRHCRNIPVRQIMMTLAVTPFVALCTFTVAYFIISVFYYGRNTSKVVFLIFALTFSSVVIAVRWSVHLFCGLKKVFVSQA